MAHDPSSTIRREVLSLVFLVVAVSVVAKHSILPTSEVVGDEYPPPGSTVVLLSDSPFHEFTCTHDGDVHAWHKSSGLARWSFSSGPPLASFRWTPDELSNEFDNSSIGISDTIDEQGWSIDEPAIFAEDDGSFIVWDPSKGTEKLKLTVSDLRTNSVHVSGGEIVIIDRTTTVFLVDAETGVLVRKLDADRLDELTPTESGKSILVVRTDYNARARNLSGTLLWKFTYGEVGTYNVGAVENAEALAVYSPLPRSDNLKPGEPMFKISTPFLTGMASPLQLPGMTVTEKKLKVASRDTALAIASMPAPSHLPAVVQKDTDSGDRDVGTPAPGPASPPQPSLGYGTIFAAISVLALALGIEWFAKKRSSPKVVEKVAGNAKKKKARKVSPGKDVLADLEVTTGAATVSRVKRRATNNYGPGTEVGRLFVTKVVIGSGSNGTLVLEGYLHDRKVAVKRLLNQFYEKAEKEIALLIASDEHPNVVRYYWMEETSDFVYVALERCSFSLHDLIHDQGSQQHAESAGRRLEMTDFQLWDDTGRPSPLLFQIMKDIVAGLAHLHALGIVHRDLKPHNVLISSGRIIQAKIADMGLSKRLDDNVLSYDAQLTGHGSSGSRGWQAPEQLLRGRGSRAVDIFSLGCVLFHCITCGRHPFGSHFDRDRNISLGQVDLFPIVDFPEAQDLIERLLNFDPSKRPPAQDILRHPFFWNSEERLAFLRDASDRVEIEVKGEKNPDTKLFAAVESLEQIVFGAGGGWESKVDFTLLQNARTQRRYNYKSVRDLLRVIRNKLNHFNDLPVHLQGMLGPIPDGFEKYFTSRFPHLLIQVYQVMVLHCKGEPFMERYFTESYYLKLRTRSS